MKTNGRTYVIKNLNERSHIDMYRWNILYKTKQITTVQYDDAYDLLSQLCKIGLVKQVRKDVFVKTTTSLISGKDEGVILSRMKNDDVVVISINKSGRFYNDILKPLLDNGEQLSPSVKLIDK
jgi:hypothetical protein